MYMATSPSAAEQRLSLDFLLFGLSASRTIGHKLLQANPISNVGYVCASKHMIIALPAVCLASTRRVLHVHDPAHGR